jgi:hypothetical protein
LNDKGWRGAEGRSKQVHFKKVRLDLDSNQERNVSKRQVQGLWNIGEMMNGLKFCFYAISSTNVALGLNQGLRGENPANARLSCGTVPHVEVLLCALLTVVHLQRSHDLKNRG